MASVDSIAADAVAAKAMGFNPLDLGFLYYAQKLGFGVADLNKIEVLGLPIAAVERAFKPHEATDKQLQWRVDYADAYLPAG